jgi:hypothetical protein
MDRALFDRTRQEVQDELKALGETVVIPDPNDGEYLSTFMAIQRKHPRLAARLVEAEQADPADLLPPPPDRPSRPTWRHRVNHITQRLWMRRGLDGNLVWDRNRVLRSGLITAGTILGGVLIYSVAAPRPMLTASAPPATTETSATSRGDTTADTNTDTSGAFPEGTPDPNRASDPKTQAQLDEIAAAEATGTITPEETPLDEPPRPVTASTSGATPPPPAVFREVEVPEETAPLPAPIPDPAPMPAPVLDAPPIPVAASASPFGGEDPAPPPVQQAPVPDAPPTPVTASAAPFGGEDPAPPPVEPFALADTRAPEPSPAPPKPKPLKTVSPPPFTPAKSDALFGGDDTPPTPVPSPATMATAPAPTRTTVPVTTPQVEVEPPPARGQALVYQKPPEAKTQEQAQAPRSALVYQASAREGNNNSDAGSTNAPRTAMVYQATAGKSPTSPEGRTSPADTTSRSALVYQAPAQSGTISAASNGEKALTFQQGSQEQTVTTSATSTPGSALMYQRSSSPSTVAGAPAGAPGPVESGTTAAAPQVDPDAPKFSPTTQIPGKTLTAIRTAAGVAVPLVVVSNEGNWIGTATYNAPLGRVDMTFNSFVHMKSGKTYSVQALGYQAAGGNLTQGVAANVHPIAPTLGLDLMRAGLNSLNVYTQTLANASTSTTNGSVTTITRQAPTFVQVFRGEVGKLAQLPEDNQTISTVADVATNTDVIILFGVGPTANTP